MKKGKLIGKIFGIALVFVMVGSMLGGLHGLVGEAEASPATIYVPDNYATIQAAVDAASPGDAIIVRDGTYTENVDVNKSVTLLGENLENTTVVGGFKVTADNVVIENFTIAGGYEWDPDGAGLGGAYRAGIYVVSCDNVQISNNRIESIRGGTGGAGVGSRDPGGAGGVGSGIYLSSSTGDNLTSNTIYNIQGGTGGTGGTYAQGGAGGVGAGIYLSSSTGDNLTSNTIETIQGGAGGAGGYDGGSGGTGGIGTGIYLSSSTGDNLIANTIDNIQGGTGGTGGGKSGSGGTGGIGAAIYLSSSSGDNLTSNTIDNISGGTGGTGGGKSGSGGTGGIGAGIYLSSSTGDNLTSSTMNNIPGGAGGAAGSLGSGGADQVGFGVYLDGSSENNYLGVSGSEFNTLDGDPILYFYNMTGLVIENYTLTASSNPTNYGKIVLINCTNCTVENNTVRNFVGMSGSTGGKRVSGGPGGMGAGIYLSSSTGANLTSNTIENILGGTGGTGGYASSGGTGGIGAGIYVSSSTGDNLISNTIDDISGGTGGSGANSGSAGAGGIGAGIYLSSSSGENLTSNTIDNVWGGTGNPAGYAGSAGGAGGMGAGIYLLSSSGDNLTSNVIDFIWGGAGGSGVPGAGGSGGEGGIGAAIYLSSSTGENLASNLINNIQGGAGGSGSTRSGGAGGIGAGIYLSSSAGDNLTSNTINTTQGGAGGAGVSGSGGADQVGFGIYLDGSSQNNYLGVSGSEFNTLDGDPILYFYNMTGLVIENYTLIAPSNPTNYGKIALISCTNCTVENNTVRNFVGMSGSTGGSGGDGGLGAGIHLSSSTGTNLTSNTIENILGGTGGTGGYHGTGGAGGIGAGIYVSSSSGDNLTSNTINDISGGTGGFGGYGGGLGGAGGTGAGIYVSSSTGDSLASSQTENIQGGTGGAAGAGGSGGATGVGAGSYLESSDNNTISNCTSSNNPYGLYLSSSSNNTIYNNYFNNTNNAYDDGTNTWNSTKQITYTYNGKTYTNYLGNYWSDYTGEDANGDGIGETPYSIDSDADNYPLMEPFENYTIVEYDLAIASTAGGEITTPDEGTFTYYAGTVVSLVASPASGYRFVNWTGNVSTIANVNAASTNITMNGDYSITATFTTLPDTTPPAAVTDLAISAATDNCITLTWTSPGDDGNVSSASQYDIRYSASNITEANWDPATQCTGEPSPQPAGSSESFVVTGLSPETTYYFALKTADEVPNWSGLSNVASGTTSSKAGGSVSGVVRETNGITSIGGAKTFAYDFTQGTLVSGAESADDGTYTIIGLPAGSYKVKATSSGYVDEWYQEETSSDKADHVHVTAGKDTPDIDFSLSCLCDTPIGGNVTVIDPYSGVTMVFAHVSEAGVTSINPSEGNPSGNITGFKFLGKYYDIKTTAVYTGPVSVTIVYDEADVPSKEEKLKLFHLVDTVWEPLPPENQSVDTINNMIIGVVDTLSWFAIAKPEGGCFIATAAYGTPMAEEIQILRGFRDDYLLTSPVGQALVGLYYRVSPPMAEFITKHPSLKPIVRAGLVPAVAMSTVAVNTTPAEKTAIVGLLVLFPVALAVWATRRRRRGPEHT